MDMGISTGIDMGKGSTGDSDMDIGIDISMHVGIGSPADPGMDMGIEMWAWAQRGTHTYAGTCTKAGI